MTNFSSSHPNIVRWAEFLGRIEIGQDHDAKFFVQVLDEGGIVWEGKRKYDSLENALDDLETALAKIINEIG